MPIAPTLSGIRGAVKEQALQAGHPGANRNIRQARPLLQQHCVPRRSGAFHEQHDIVGVRIIKEYPRPLIQHVRIDPIRPQERNPTGPDVPFGLQAANFRGQFRELVVDILLGGQPPIARKGIDAEIPDQCGGHGVEAERSQDSSQAAA